MILFLSLVLVLSILGNIWQLLPKIDNWYHWKRIGAKPKPQNPNSAIQECQFCGAEGAQRSIDGYWVCSECKVIRLHQIA